MKCTKCNCSVGYGIKLMTEGTLWRCGRCGNDTEVSKVADSKNGGIKNEQDGY